MMGFRKDMRWGGDRAWVRDCRHVGIIALMVVGILLAGCGGGGSSRSSGQSNDTSESDYVGIWVNYKSRLQDGSWRWYTQDLDPMMYCVIFEDGTAEIVNTTISGEPDVTKCHWHQAKPGSTGSDWEDQGLGTENDIVLLTDDYEEYPLTYEFTTDSPTNIAETLVKFNLVMDPFGHYLEKISNDPNETPWSFTDAREGDAQEYVGIWVNCRIGEGGSWTDLEIGKDNVIYAVINEDATATMIGASNDLSPIVKKWQWRTIQGNDESGAYYGIRLSNSTDGIVQFIKDESLDKPDFIDARLVEFSLLNGQNPTSCFEKISNDSSEAPWEADYGIHLDEAETGAAIPDGAIDWTEAGSHIGEYVTVFGTVKDSSYLTSSNGQPSYIDIGAAYPDDTRVTMVVWGEDRANFSGEPDQMYLGKTICVTGELYEYEGVAYVKVSTPGQIQVIE